MQIIDQKAIAFLRSQVRNCEVCGNWLAGGSEAHHLQARGMGGGCRLDVPFGVAMLCGSCHTRLHSGNLPKSAPLACVAFRCRVAESTIVDALRFLRSVPARPLAGEVPDRFEQLTSAAQALVHPFVKEML